MVQRPTHSQHFLLLEVTAQVVQLPICNRGQVVPVKLSLSHATDVRLLENL